MAESPDTSTVGKRQIDAVPSSSSLVNQLIRIVEASTNAIDQESTVKATLGAVLSSVEFEGMTFLLKTENGGYELVARENVDDRFASKLASNSGELARMFAPYEGATGPITLRRKRGDGWIIDGTGQQLPEVFLNSTAFESALWLPLRHGDSFLGFLCMGAPDSREWASDELAWFSDLARMTSAIINHAAVVEREKAAELARERARTERELRDHVMQALGYSLLQDMEPTVIREMIEVDDHGLSDRELSVLEQVATGASNREIAAALYMSENTVKKHLQNILTKLNLSNRVQVAVFAVENGIGRSSQAQR